jgi:hypothetical protein
MMPTALIVWALLQAPGAATSLPPSTVALVETYADGRVAYELTSAKPAWMWTPVFPRVTNWQPPAGSLPVTALRIARVLVGSDVRVDVSLLRGPSHQEETAVATVLVRPGGHVLVNQLRAYGVEPIDLSLAEAAPLTPYLPTVFSVTPKLEIAAVDLLNAPYPGYRITVRSLSDQAAANFHMQSYRGESKALGSIPRGPEGRPVLTPGGSFTFDVNLTGGRKTDAGLWAPTPLDVIEIDSVLWEDGSIDGTPATASSLIAPDAGRRLQLTRVTAILRSAMKEGTIGVLPRIRREIEALADQDEGQLPAAQASMRLAKQAALSDVERFERDRSAAHDPQAEARWLKYTADRYDAWIKRLAQ